MKTILALLFFLTALLYASVGFGGGSTYSALLVLAGINYTLIPFISLVCNIIVVSGNVIGYTRQKLISLTHIWPLLILSVPFAWLGGRLQIPKTIFIALLALALLFAGLSMLLKPKNNTARDLSLPMMSLLGGGLGLVSGMVGIGGGIFLAPILHKTGFGTSKQIAATCSLFILVNSVSGLIGQGLKLGDIGVLQQATEFWPLAPLVLIGGLFGNRLGTGIFSDKIIRRLTALLVIFVALRLLWQLVRPML